MTKYPLLAEARARNLLYEAQEDAKHARKTAPKYPKGGKPHLAGENNGRAKITQAIVNEIRSSKDTQKVLGERYNISQSQVSKIKRGDSWQYTQSPENSEAESE